jgi:hypothetical protein
VGRSSALALLLPRRESHATHRAFMKGLQTPHKQYHDP